MSEKDRRAAATATVGYGTAVTGGVLGEHALHRAHQVTGMRRRALLPHRVFRHTKTGRGRYALGSALLLAGAPAAVKGTYDLTSKRDDRKPFLVEGVHGAEGALREKAAPKRTPRKVQAGNLAIGLTAGLGTSEIASRALSRVPRVGRVGRAALATAAGLGASAATIPVQNRISRHARGYQKIPSGVRRKKTAPVRPSRYATVVDGRSMSGAAFRQQSFDKADPGAGMSRARRRAAVTAAGPPIPVFGDLAQAATAASLSPRRYRHRTAAQTYGANVGGGAAGTAAGAVGAAALARRHAGFERRANALNERVEGARTNIRARVPVPRGGGTTKARLIEHTPTGLKRTAGRLGRTSAVRLVRSKPGVAAIGGLVGGAIGGQAAQQASYSHIMTRDDRYRRMHSHNAHGSRVGKADRTTGMSRREEVRQIQRKQHAAVASYTAGGLGLTSLGALGAAALPKVPHAVRGKLARAATYTGIAGAGVGGVTGLRSTHLQQRELRARKKVLLNRGGVSKAFGLKPTGLLRPPRPPGMPKTPSMRAGFTRQVRTPSGLTRTSTVRGSLG